MQDDILHRAGRIPNHLLSDEVSCQKWVTLACVWMSYQQKMYVKVLNAGYRECGIHIDSI